MKKLLIVAQLFMGVLYAQTDTPLNDTIDFELRYSLFVDSVEKTLEYTNGTVTLKNDIGTIEVPYGFKYLDGDKSDMILTDIWGNPPSDEENKSLGMLVKEDETPFTDASFCINITYAEEGFIEDDDAKDIDYEELLESMQDDAETSNEYREEAGYERIELVGWASEPFYDEETKKLHWAKELKFGDYEGPNTLNYNIRILGRKGYLQLNAIGEMLVLQDVKNNINPILASVNFTKGNTYSDFDPDMDEVAAYGIGGLIAGKVLLKAGLLAKFGILLAKFWKVILIAGAALFGGFKKFFSKKKEG